MTIYEAIQYAYQFITGILCVLLTINIINERKLSKQLTGAFVLLPFILRFLLVK